MVMYGPPIRSTQYGTAANISSRISLIERGDPGKLRIKVEPRIPAVCLESTAVGTCFSEIARICSPKPGSILSQTASVASGVTSLGAGPVPPVVMMTEHPSSHNR